MIAKSLALAALITFMWSGTLQAQTGCTTGPTSGTISSADTSPKVVLCANQSNGPITGINVSGIGAAKIAATALTTLTTADASGNLMMQGTLPKIPKGHYTVTATVTNVSSIDGTVQESGPSVTPFTLDSNDPNGAPPPPTNLRLVP